MKKYVAMLLAVLMVMTLSGCKKDEPQLKPEPPVSSDEDVSGDRVEFFGDEHYSRLEIIERNESFNAETAGSSQVAMDYILNKYPGRIVETSDFVRGYTMPRGMFVTDEYSGGVDVWNVTSGKEGETQEQEEVQIVYFCKAQEGYASAVLSGEQIITDKLELREYLKQDTRLEGKTCDIPKVKLPGNAKWVDATKEMGIYNGYFIGVLDNGMIAINSGVKENTGLCSVVIYDCEAEKIATRYDVENPTTDAQVQGNTVVFSEFSSNGTYMYSLSEDGELSEKVKTDGRNIINWSENQIIYEENNNIYLGNTANRENELLVEGVAGQDIDAKAAKFFAKLDEQRFIYTIDGWEWIDAVGVYNVKTGENQKITMEDGKPFMQAPVKLAGNKLFCADVGGEAESGFYVADLTAMTAQPLELKADDKVKSTPISYSVFSPDGARCYVVNGNNIFAAFDTVTGEELYNFELDIKACTMQALAADNANIYILIHEYLTDSDTLVILPVK